jgi:hypothetical protein
MISGLDEGRFYTSLNYGDIWKISSGDVFIGNGGCWYSNPYSSFAFDAFDTNTSYIASLCDVRRTTGGGLSYKKIHVATSGELLSTPDSIGHVFLYFPYDGLYESFDHGDSWHSISMPPYLKQYQPSNIAWDKVFKNIIGNL